MKEVYLDNAATTKPYPEVVKAIEEALTINYGNPSSLHRKGLVAEKMIKEARKEIASKLSVNTEEIYFTSGGTEANNLAIQGAVKALRRYGNRIITTTIEHPSVLNIFKSLEEEGLDVKYINVNKDGIIKIQELKEYLNEDTIVVSIMGVNNEVGSIQPIAEIGRLLSNYDNLYFHVDGVQAFGKIDFKLNNLGVDLCSISSHKIHGPKGTGALYIKKGTRINNLIFGSRQEKGVRPGTENVPGIVGFGKAVELLPDRTKLENMYNLKGLLVNRILKEIEGSSLNGPDIKKGAAHIANISFAGIKGEVLIHSLENDNIYLSTGAACSSRQKTSSYILESIGVEERLLTGAIRFSLASTTTEKEINYTVDKLKENIKTLRRIMGDNNG